MKLVKLTPTDGVLFLQLKQVLCVLNLRSLCFLEQKDPEFSVCAIGVVRRSELYHRKAKGLT